MPLEVKKEKGKILRCSWCGRLITGEPLSVKTCCVNKPWHFCGDLCYRQFVAKWTKNQDALSKKESRLGKGAF